MEYYVEVVKLIVYKKIEVYILVIKLVKNSIFINYIGNIVSNVVNWVLLKESIIWFCFEVVIKESGNINSDFYFCWLSLIVNRFKKELIEKILVLFSRYLGLEICVEM